MNEKVYCINCYNFYIQDKLGISMRKMKTECTPRELLKHLNADDIITTHASKYPVDIDTNICKISMKYDIVYEDTYKKREKNIILSNAELCENLNLCNQCDLYDEIQYIDKKIENLEEI